MEFRRVLFRAPSRTRTRTKTVKAPTSLRPRVTTSSSNKPAWSVGRIDSGRPQTLPGVAQHSLQLVQPTIRRESHEREPGFPLIHKKEATLAGAPLCT